MKKKSILAAALLTAFFLAVSAYASGGSASDPLISLSYLKDIFKPTVDSALSSALDDSDEQLYAGALDAVNSASSVTAAESYTETRLKKSDTLTGSTGTNVLVLAGSVTAHFSSGAVVDVTTGSEVSSGSTLTPRHRYMVAEDTTAAFIVTSKTACLDYMGPYSFTYSGETDYTAMATALKTLHLFKGSFTGYGSGYDLENTPTRLQALIMFIRVLGEEEAALAYTGSCPFTDVAAGTEAARYVGYAYEKGYTNGYTATLFKPGLSVNAYQYTEFLLRALGYSSAENTNLSATLTNAYSYGIITAGELSMLQTTPFTRAELVYLSYYALGASLQNSSTTLQQALISKGVFTSSELSAAKALVSGSRL